MIFNSRQKSKSSIEINRFLTTSRELRRLCRQNRFEYTGIRAVKMSSLFSFLKSSDQIKKDYVIESKSSLPTTRVKE